MDEHEHGGIGKASFTQDALEANVKAFVGDFSTIQWGVQRSIGLEVIRYGDPDGGGDLKRNNQVIKKEQISLGGVSGTIVDPKILFKKGLDVLASGLILIHNHPSGNLKPSEADIRLTKKLKSLGQMLEIPVLDHLIFTDHGYFSFADESLM